MANLDQLTQGALGWPAVLQPHTAAPFTAVETALQKDGTLKRIRAELFAATAAVLQEPATGTVGKPPPENTFINSLIHEYLSFNGMPGTARMLALESGLHAEERLPREFLAHSLGLESDATLQEAEDLPLLYGAVGQLQAARRAAVTAGLVPTAEQPTVPPLTTAQREEVDSLAAAMARAYKADAARELARATAPAVREAAQDDRDSAPRHGDTRGGTSGDEGG
ncbi:Cep20, partial [Symbiodinium sp. KB8]